MSLNEWFSISDKPDPGHTLRVCFSGTDEIRDSEKSSSQIQISWLGFWELDSFGATGAYVLLRIAVPSADRMVVMAGAEKNEDDPNVCDAIGCDETSFIKRSDTSFFLHRGNSFTYIHYMDAIALDRQGYPPIGRIRQGSERRKD